MINRKDTKPAPELIQHVFSWCRKRLIVRSSRALPVMGAEEWVRILIGDPDLKEYVNRNLQLFTERFERYLEDIRLLKMLVAKADRHKYGKV